MPIDESHREFNLPIPSLQSEISSAIIWSLLDLQREGVKTLLVLSKSSNAYIKTKAGLPDFFLVDHDNCYSWFYEYKHEYCLEQGRVESLKDKNLIQFAIWLRRNDHERMQGFLPCLEWCPEEVKELSKPDLLITNWKLKEPPNDGGWTVLSKIKTDHLKGSKLFANGTIDW